MNTTNELEQKLTFTPIAMKCNQEQFDEIRPLLESGGCKINDISNFIQYYYLVNNFNAVQNDISNVDDGMIEDFNRKVYPEWNKKTFLNACGIAINLTDIKITMSDNPIDVSPTPKEIFKMIKPSNPLDDLPIIGDGVLMEVSDDEEDWYKAEVYCKIKDTFIAYLKANDTINQWQYARPITTKTKITRKEFESKFEIID